MLCCVLQPGWALGQDALAKKKAGRKRKGKGNADGDNEAADAADPPAVLLDGITKSDPAVLQALGKAKYKGREYKLSVVDPSMRAEDMDFEHRSQLTIELTYRRIAVSCN